MKALFACESSGKGRRAFRKAGIDAYSCDLLDADDGETKYHIKADIRTLNLSVYDFMFAMPTCTRLCVSGARWFSKYKQEQEEAIKFFMFFVYAPVKKKAIENPIGIMSSVYRKPDQIIQPWQFGHGETKATCLWLSNLPKLVPTNIVVGREARIHKMPPSPDRWKKRSESYDGIMSAMAEQWGLPDQTKGETK